MDFIVERDNFFRVLQKINNIIEEKGTLSILSKFLIKAHRDCLEITANNNEIGFQDITKAEIRRDGLITLPARKIYDIVREIPSSKEVSFTADDVGKILIKAERASFHVPYLPGENYPLMPEFSEENKICISTKDLSELLGKTFYAISPDETKRTLNGLFFTLGNSFVQTVATDGHRLALARKDSPYEFVQEMYYILPRKGVAEIRRLLSEYTGEVELNFLKNIIILRKDKHLFFTRLIEGEFPKFAGVISAAYEKRVVTDRDAISHALRRVSLMSNEINRLVAVSFQSDSLIIESGEPDLGDASETVSASYSGDPLTMGFNARYLQEVLANIDDSKVVIKLIDAGKSTRIEASDNEDFIHIVMPMRL